MEQKARASAEAAGIAYEPVTDRGGWLAEVRTIAAERLEAVRVFAQELAQRASQTWRHWTGQDREEVPSARTDTDAAERLQRGREAAQAVSQALKDRLQLNCCNGPGRLPKRGRGKAYRDLTACSAPGRSPRIRDRYQRAHMTGKGRSEPAWQ
jgi:hypothetical protein